MSYKVSNRVKEETIKKMENHTQKYNLKINRLVLASLSIVLIGTISISGITKSNDILPINEVIFNSENTSSEITAITKSAEDLSIEIYLNLKEMIVSKPLDNFETSYISHGYAESHRAYDIMQPKGSPIYAFSDGIVTNAGYTGSFGNLVIIDHGNGISSYYGHCDELLVKVGDTIKVGDNIATVGITGLAVHDNLHFEMRYNNEHFNLFDFLDYSDFYMKTIYTDIEYQKYMLKIAEYDKYYDEYTPFESYDEKAFEELSLNDIETIRFNHAKSYYEFILEKEVSPITQIEHDELQSKFDNITLHNPLDTWERISMPYSQEAFDMWGIDMIHRAYDIPSDKGTPIYSIADGIVVNTGYQGNSFGKVIVIDHGDGFMSYYAHCDELLLSVRDTVISGQNIAQVGKTGAATGYHLHFETRYNDIPFDITTFNFKDESLFNFKNSLE